MNTMNRRSLLALAALALAGAPAVHAQSASAPAPAASAPRELPKDFSFFLTSQPIGQGGNLGGLAGADAHCQKLATAVGFGRSQDNLVSTGGAGYLYCFAAN